MGKSKKGIEPDQEKELSLCPIFLLQQANRIDGVGLAGSTDFNIRDGKSGVRSNRQADHFITVLGWGQASARLMGRLTCGNEEYLVEPEGFARLARNGQVTVMHGVKAAAQETETKDAGVLSARC